MMIILPYPQEPVALFKYNSCIEKFKFRQDASHGLSYEKMIYNNNKRHPMVVLQNPNSKTFPNKAK